MSDDVVVGVTAADAQAAVDELGPADGTDAKCYKIIERTIEIELRK